MNANTQKPIIKSLIGLDLEDYLEKLKAWIIENQSTYFTDPDYEATSWCDFDDFKKTSVSRRSLCLADELMLIDREDKNGIHSYAITSINKKRKPTDHYFVIPVSQLSREHWRNGYFLLPNLQ